MRIMTDEGIAINERFFKAIQFLVDTKQMRGLGTFSRKYHVNQGNLNTIRSHQDTQSVKPEYLTYLCRDYNISAEWLLLGIGSPFNMPKQ